MDNIITAIASVGFPIVACLLMGYAYYKTITSIQLTIESLKGIIERNTDALNDIQNILITGGNENGKHTD